MQFTYTDGRNADFVGLCHKLDNFPNDLVGREKKIEQSTYLIIDLVILMM